MTLRSDAMDRRLAAIGAYSLRALIVLFTLEIAAVSILRYFTGLQVAPEPILANRFAHPFLALHVAGGVTALLLGPLQFVQRVRRRFPILHRTSGRVYAIACALGAPAGFMLALGTTSGPVAAVGFAIPALLWPVFTYLGVKCAMDGRFDEHRRWMLRSYAITSNAITLRLMLPFAGLVLHLPFSAAYPVIAWLSWMTNLALFEIYLRRTRTASVGKATLAPA
jgi:uncharacterized membrane protein